DDERRAMAHCVEVTETVNSLRALLNFHPSEKADVWVRPMSPVGPIPNQWYGRGGALDSPARVAHSPAGHAEEKELEHELKLWGAYAATMAKIGRFEVL